MAFIGTYVGMPPDVIAKVAGARAEPVASLSTVVVATP